MLISISLAQPVTAAADSVSFTRQQAERGESIYGRACLPCHQPTGGSGVIPVLVDDSFKTRWAGRPLSDLFAAIKRMPPGTPLDDESYVNITAHLLKTHGLPFGDSPLPLDVQTLASMTMPPSEDSISTDTVPGDARHPLLASLSPVTAGQLANPPAGDWLSFGRTNERNGYSPLHEINQDTVHRLAPSWSRKLAAGTNNPTPLIHDGVMFLYTFPDTVMALDATNGHLLWRYRHEPVGVAASRKMGIALGDDKVFVPTSDMHMLALDMKTGEKIWTSTIATRKDAAAGTERTANPMSRYDLRAAPIIAAGKVIMGVVSSVVPTGGFIFALDMKTGEESWRFRTIAQPGTPGGHSWNGLPAEQRSGGSVWSSASYEPDLDLVYFGIAPTYRVQPFYKPSNDPSQTREARYTNGTVALDPDTGELRWSYSHHILDHWDLDWAFERHIMDLSVHGRKRRVVATVSKGALLDALDAATGEYLFSVEMGIQTTISAIDPVTGMKTNNPQTEPGREGPYLVCPAAFGARSWTPTAYDATSKLLYQPFIEACFSANVPGYPMLITGVSGNMGTWPGSKGKIGRLHAIDMEKGETRWLHRQVTPIVSSTLATAGGLVFAGDLDPSLKAFDSASGELLWQRALTDDPSSSIVTYAVNGRQYLALVIGQSNNHHRDWKNYYNRITSVNKWPRPAPVEGSGPSIQVFALPTAPATALERSPRNRER